MYVQTVKILIRILNLFVYIEYILEYNVLILPITAYTRFPSITLTRPLIPAFFPHHSSFQSYQLNISLTQKYILKFHEIIKNHIYIRLI